MDDFDINAIDIAQLFDTTSAVNSYSHSQADREAMDKRGSFERFCKKMQDSTMLATSIGNFKTFAVLMSSDMKRFYRADDGETVEMFAARLRGEAISMNARWSFVAMLAPYAMGDIPAGVEARDMNSILDGVENGLLRMGICFFAEKSQGTDRARRSGVIELDKEGSPLGIISGNTAADGNPFTSVMDK